MENDDIQCRVVRNTKIDHHISFKLVVVGTAG
jgi:hypothetical protein